MPLVGVPAPRLVTNGIATSDAWALPFATGGWPLMRAGAVDTPGMNGRNIGLAPTAELPPNTLLPVDVANASCVPMSCAKERDADTTLASISTCCDLRSSCDLKLSMVGITEGMSRMIRVFEQSSERM